MNTSHLIPILKSFPANKVWSEEDLGETRTTFADAWRRIPGRSSGLNLVNEPLSKVGLQCQCGFFMSPNYLGIDAVIPAMLRNGHINYIPIQIKMNVDDVIAPICRMATQCHFSVCLKHGNRGCQCEKRTSAANFSEIVRDQVSLLLTATPTYTSSVNSLQTNLNHESDYVTNWMERLHLDHVDSFTATKEANATGMIPDLVAEEHIRSGLRMVTLYWDEFDATHTCFVASGFNNFPVMHGQEELALDIVRYYTDPFGTIYQEQVDPE